MIYQKVNVLESASERYKLIKSYYIVMRKEQLEMKYTKIFADEKGESHFIDVSGPEVMSYQSEYEGRAIVEIKSQERKGEEGASGSDIPVSKIQDPGGTVDQGQPQRHKGINAARCETRNQVL